MRSGDVRSAVANDSVACSVAASERPRDFVAGGLAARIGAPHTILIGGCACILGGIVFSRQLPRLRELVVPIYVERGILPEIATGLSNAAALRDESET